MFSFGPNPTRAKNAWSSSTCLLYGSEPKKCVLPNLNVTRIFTQNSTVQLQKCGMLHDFACHPCTGAMLIFSVLYCSNFSICTAEASTLDKDNREIWTKEKAWTKMCFIKIWNLVKTTRIFTQNSTVQLQKCGTLHGFGCHPCAWAMLIFSVTFQF